MTKEVEVALKAVKKLDENLSPDTVWQTNQKYVFISKAIGIPPVIVDKRTNNARYAVIGDESDMALVFRRSRFVGRIKK